VNNHKHGFSLLELIIAIAILSAMILGINSISIFTRNNVVTADRRAKLQNDVSRILDHVSRMATLAIGNESVNGANSAIVAGTGTLDIFVDSNQNGTRDSVSAANDHWIYYNRDINNNNFNYCDTCLTTDCSASCDGASDIVATNITDFTVTKAANFSTGNFVEISVTACYNPALTCGTVDNPSVTMSARVSLPGVSVN